ncbi:MAG: hypothetical protein BWY05_01572 [Euryarchaeota archaeon ADurb.Bin165]|nr:MAG: hypothetical protein BWY05_01572 [Euryarchaeota archaeon ADurb.Bin165]
MFRDYPNRFIKVFDGFLWVSLPVQGFLSHDQVNICDVFVVFCAALVKFHSFFVSFYRFIKLAKDLVGVTKEQPGSDVIRFYLQAFFKELDRGMISSYLHEDPALVKEKIRIMGLFLQCLFICLYGFMVLPSFKQVPSFQIPWILV